MSVSEQILLDFRINKVREKYPNAKLRIENNSYVIRCEETATQLTRGCISPQKAWRDAHDFIRAGG